ncbi:Methylase involved in ubiquinone/menaquinone biosynthesis [Frankia canadensis]|uniref:Methylase involved in ubiquinone/menaquinone biosynthesis n=1 Tax=Frankia canadensis TaxID=1836972 RepID=A0A2I2KU76_9ACTN|nr:methyltransferase domain-containing protein [Frankia canadensis]SNQ49209.1 Methylase involved in ubiquinone/menaquinone biosynthesis [Frankia canadensis]SOU56499.1 Methylase involved in ubiquinone/menaquinone biosynthesis [Frankia canadensis]
MDGHVVDTDLRRAAVWPGLRAVLPAPDPRAVIIDAGGGSGGFAVPIAAAGHAVTVVDPSPDALAALRRRAAERGLAERITAVQGDLGDLVGLVGAGRAQVLLCHSVLEVVDDPPSALAEALRVLRPGGALSLVVPGAAAAVVRHAVAGRVDEALAALLDEGPRPRGVPRRYSTAGIATLVRAAGAEVLEVHGVRIFADLVPAERRADPGAAERLLRLELAAARHPALRDLAAQLHVLARRPGPGPAPPSLSASSSLPSSVLSSSAPAGGSGAGGR